MLTAVLLLCTSPVTLRLELATTQHAPAWFCVALLGAFAVWLELEPRRARRWPVIALLVLVVGTIVGVNAASDPLLSIAGVAPFALAMIAAHVLVPGHRNVRALWSGAATLAVTGVTWAITAVAMSALAVTREPGLHTTRIAIGHKNIENFTLWWKSVATIGNGDYFSRALSPGTVLEFLCAVLSIAAVVSIPWLAWRELRRRTRSAAGSAATVSPGVAAFYVFWCSSAILLTLAFLFSDVARATSTRTATSLGLLYAAAAVVPAAAARRVWARAIVLGGTCAFALSAVAAISDRGAGPGPRSPLARSAPQVAGEIARIAAREHLIGRVRRLLGCGADDLGHRVPRAGLSRCRVRPANAPVSLRSALHKQLVLGRDRAPAASCLTDDRSARASLDRTPDLGRPTAGLPARPDHDVHVPVRSRETDHWIIDRRDELASLRWGPRGTATTSNV